MPPAAETPEASWRTYHRATRTATFGFLSALPLLLLYEALILLVNRDPGAAVRVGADVWMKQVLGLVGAAGTVGFGVAVLVVGTVIVFRERKKRIPLRPRYMGLLVAESAVYAVVVAVIVSHTVAWIFALAPQGGLEGQGTFTLLVLSVGAGLYEELVFRVLLVGGLFWALQRLLPDRRGAYVAAALVGAFLFSLVHYTGPFADDFTAASFSFRFLFGLALNAIFLARGFGAAAWTHALYDVLVVLSG